MKTKKSRFDRLVAKYYPSVFRLASRLASSSEQAAALAKATFERASRHVGHFRSTESVRFLLLTSLSEELSAGPTL